MNDTFRTCALCDYGSHFEEIRCISDGEDESWDVCSTCGAIEGPVIEVDENGEKV